MIYTLKVLQNNAVVNLDAFTSTLVQTPVLTQISSVDNKAAVWTSASNKAQLYYPMLQDLLV
jgi:hypothetical protein